MNEHLSQRGFETVNVDKISGLIVTAAFFFSIATFNRSWAKCGMGKPMLPKSRLFGSKQKSCLLQFVSYDTSHDFLSQSRCSSNARFNRKLRRFDRKDENSAKQPQAKQKARILNICCHVFVLFVLNCFRFMIRRRAQSLDEAMWQFSWIHKMDVW